jgi:prepilin-type N-terminal cleavage/methylation domain-containing protein
MKRNRKQRGFTLMEAMMAVFILAVAASGISMAFAAAGTVQVEAQRRILASRLAADKIEEMVADGYGYVKTKYVYVGFSPLYSRTAGDMGYTGNIYNGLSYTVEECKEVSVPVPAGNQTVHLIRVTVVAKYNNQEITRLTTLIGDKNKH